MGNEKFSHVRPYFHEFFRLLRQFFSFYGSEINSDFVTAKVRKDPKMTQIPPFLCNDPEKKSTWYTILHITHYTCSLHTITAYGTVPLQNANFKGSVAMVL